MLEQTQKKERLQWITYTKAICMLIVYFSHTANYYCGDITWLRPLYEPFYVNAFFVASGYLLFRKQVNQMIPPNLTGGGKMLILSVLYKLILPSSVFAALTYVPKMLFSSTEIELETFFDKTIGGMTYWFTSALVVAEMLIWLMLKTKLKNIWFYFSICLLISCLAIYGIEHEWFIIKNYWMFKQGLLCLAFLGLGGIYWKYEEVFRKIMNKWTIPIVTAIYVVFVYAPWWEVAITTSMCNVNYLGLIIATIGSLLLLELCKILPMNRFIQFIGDNSIGFYFLCGIMPIVFSAAFHHFLPSNDWLMILVYIFSVAAAFSVVWFIKKYLPFLFDFSILK